MMLGCQINANDHAAFTPIKVSANGKHLENQFQYDSSVWITVFNEKLFFCPRSKLYSNRTSHDGWLCSLQSDGIEKIHQLDDAVILCQKDQYLYYNSKNELFCFDFLTNTESPIDNHRFTLPAMYFEDGTIALPLDDHESGLMTEFLLIAEEECPVLKPLNQFYSLGESEYCIVPQVGFINSSGGGNSIYARNKNKDWQELELSYADVRTMIPTAKGYVIHNQGGKDLLYDLDEEGNLHALFSVPYPYSDSAVTIVNDDFYISVTERNRSGNWNKPRTEPSVDGLYRINLLNRTSEKLSDSVFDGLYNFNDSYLIACDEKCNVYQLSLEGDILKVLIQMIP